MTARAPGVFLAAIVVATASTAEAQRTRIIQSPAVGYQRGYAPSFPAAAGFTYQSGYAAPVVIPNYATVPAIGPSGVPRPVPYLSTPAVGQMNTYPGYGFGFGTGYGFGSGYGYGYPGYVYGFNSAGALYPTMPTGVYAPPRVLIENGYYRR